MKCPYCNQEIPDGSKFCTYCGQNLESGDAQAPEETSTEPAAEAESADSTDSTADTEGEDIQNMEVPSEVPNEELAPADPAAGIPKEPAEGKKSNKKLAVGAAVVAGVAIIAAAAFALSPSKDPKTTVIDAFKSVTAEGQKSPMNELFGVDALYKKMQTESADISMEIAVNDISDETMASLKTGKVFIGAKQDMENKQYSAELGIGYADMDLARFQMYFDDKNVTMAIPELSGKAFSFNYADDLEGQIDRSPYLGPIIKESGVDVNAFKEYFEYIGKVSSSGGQIFDMKALWERYKEGSKAIDNLKAAMTVEKAEKKNLTMDGKEQSCMGYNVTITKDALIEFLNTSKDFIMSDETIKSDFLEYVNQVMKLSYSMNQMYGTQDQITGEQTWAEMEQGLTEAISQLEESMGDITMVVYVDKAGRLAAMEANTTAVVEEKACEISLDVAFQGGYRLTANGNATLTLTTDSDTLTVELNKTGNYDDKEFTGNYELTASVGDESFTLNYNGAYTIPDSTYHIDLGMSGNGYDVFTVSSDGQVQDLEKGKAISLMIDSVKIEVPEAENLMIDLGGSYKVASLSGPVDMPQGEVLDIFEATEEEWTTVSQEMTKNLFGLMFKLQ